MIGISISMISAMFTPTMETVLQLIVKEDKIVEANSINSFLTSTGCVIAPIIAGMLLSKFNISEILLINGISFLFSAFTEGFLKIPNKKNTCFKKFSLKKYKEEFVDGIRYIKTITTLKYIGISA